MNNIIKEFLKKGGLMMGVILIFLIIWIIYTAFFFMPQGEINKDYNAGCYYYPDDMPVWEGNKSQTKNSSNFSNFSNLSFPLFTFFMLFRKNINLNIGSSLILCYKKG